MNYNVIILDKPFRRNISSIKGMNKFVKTKKTAEITFLDDNGIIEKSVEYGYKSSEDIQNEIDCNADLILSYCYVVNLCFSSNPKQHVLANDTFFSGETSFSSTTFSRPVSFKNVVFDGNVDFSFASFDSYARFTNSFFYGRADFSSATFSDCSFFLDLTFNDIVTFENAVFKDEFYCADTEFKKLANFEDVVFKGDVDIEEVVVDREISFGFSKFVSCTKLHFSRCNALLLYNCEIAKSFEVICTSNFISLSIESCKCFGNFSAPFDMGLRDAIMNYDITDIRAKAQQFNFLKVNYNRNGEYEYEDQAYVEYRRCLRKTKNRFLRFAEWVFLDLISCYCTKPFHVFYAAIIAIAFFAGLYFIPSTISFQPSNQPVIEITLLQQLWNRLYHSIITFFTIGYGNIIPMGWIGLLLTSLEGFIGVFLMSLFTVSFVRKTLR